jgi:GNAT superfamily N-acetyltransferase
VIRAATSRDFWRIREMIREMFADVSAYGHRDSSGVVIHMVENAIQAGQKIFVGEWDDKVVGICAWVQSPSTPGGEVLGLGTFVEANFRRMGISSDLRDAATDYWKAEGASHISGTVDIGNTPGLDSAIEHGFAFSGFIVEKQLNA